MQDLKGFIVSEKPKVKELFGYPVLSISELNDFNAINFSEIDLMKYIYSYKINC